MTSVDNVFRDTSGATYNEFTPVSLLIRPYVQELQAAADAHVKHEYPADAVAIGSGKPVYQNCKKSARTSLLTLLTRDRHWSSWNGRTW